jgi:hypothetical protein
MRETRVQQMEFVVMSDWTRNEKIALYSLIVAIIGVVIMLFTVQEFRRAIGLNPERSHNDLPQVSTNSPNNTTQSSLTLKDALQRFRYEHGWSGGAANSGDTKKVSYYPVTSVRLNGDQVVINYSWKNGVLSGSLNGRELTGTWQQSDGRNVESGDLFLRFNEDYSVAQGWWKDKDTGESGASYLRRVP